MTMFVRMAAVLVVFLAATGVSTQTVTAGPVEDLRAEHDAITTEVLAAQKDHDRLEGGLLKTLIAVRLELLKTNAALVQQRIHAADSGARITMTVSATNPDPKRASVLQQEMRSLEKEVALQKAESTKYSGGLVKAMLESGIATSQMSIAMLQTEYLKAKYGIHWVPSLNKQVELDTQPGPTRTKKTDRGGQPAANFLTPTLKNKRFLPADYKARRYDDALYFDIDWDTSRLDRPTRAAKGVFIFADLFGETQFRLRLTINQPLRPNQKFTQRGLGFEYNKFSAEHHWVRTTDLSDMTFRFDVQEVIYADGTRDSFNTSDVSN